MVDPEKVAYLLEFFSASEIRVMWKSLGDTQRDFATDPLQITSHSEAGESSAAILVTNSEQASIWMASAREAYRQASGETGIDPDRIGRGTDWSKRMVRA